MSDTEVPPGPPPEEESDSEDQDVEMAEPAPTTEVDEPKSPETSSNIHTSKEYMELDEPFVADDKKALLEEFERKKRARMITVPTDDSEVQRILRQNEEPICMFGEGPADRRNRLKDFLSRRDDAILDEKSQQQLLEEKQRQESIAKEDTWYHRGPKSLKEARMFIVNYSVPRARSRLKKEKAEQNMAETVKKARKQGVQSKLRTYALIGSQNADCRPVSKCVYSPNSELIASCSWSGLCKVWQSADCKEKLKLTGHTGYVDCIAWHPGSGINMEPTTLNLVSSGRDGRVLLWNLRNTEPISQLPKIDGRVASVGFHPSGRFIGYGIDDNSWRLFDLSAEEEVLFQEGHSKAVHCIGFQKDGALVATGGKDCYGRIWDARTGRCVMFLSGHIGSLLCLDWSPNGYEVATGSDDNSTKIWDVRARKCTYTIPSHSCLVSGVMYEPSNGDYLATCSYDGTVKLWLHGSFQPLKTLEGHCQKVMGLDISTTSGNIITCAFDRTFKIWGPE